MISDQDDHIRRNIVLVSSGILLAAWLELPGTSLLASVLPNGTQIAPHKLWAVGFALLAYLGLRYQFTADGKEFQSQLNKQVRDFRLEIMVNSLDQPAVKRYSYEDACKLFSEEQLRPLVSQAIQRSGNQHTPTETPWVHVEDLYLKTNRSLHSTIKLEFKNEGRASLSVPCLTRPTHEWSRPYAFFRFGIPASLKAWIYSPAAIQYMAPIALAVTAEAVMLSRLVVSYWTI